MSQSNYLESADDYIDLYSKECTGECKHCKIRKECQFYEEQKPKRKGKKGYKED